jgi:restriction endonuclease S subunit
MELGKCVNIRTGLVLSRKKVNFGASLHVYSALSLKALSADNNDINRNLLEPYSTFAPLKNEYFTHNDDILVRLSAPYTIALITESLTGLLVSSHFAIIRTENKEIDSRFLYRWLLKNRHFFTKMASGGTMMGTISCGYIRKMRFSPPPIELQQKIGNLLQLANREQRLLLRFAEAKKRLIDGLVQNNF